MPISKKIVAFEFRGFKRYTIERMRKYELTIVLPGSVTPVKKKAAKEKIEKLIKVLKGVVVKFDDWGEKQLAYEIKKNTSGTFLHFQIELDGNFAKEIDKKLRLDEEVIRYLLVKVNSK